MRIISSDEHEIRAVNETEIFHIEAHEGLILSRADRKTGKGRTFYFDYAGRLMRSFDCSDTWTQAETFLRDVYKKYFEKGGRPQTGDDKSSYNIYKKFVQKGPLTREDIVASMLKVGQSEDVIRSLDNNIYRFREMHGPGEVIKNIHNKSSFDTMKNIIYTRLNEDEKRAFLEHTYLTAGEVYETLDGNLNGHIKTILEQIVGHNLKTLEDDARKFSSLYSKIGVLPPFLYDTVLVQLTEGCAWNKCNFCDLYKETSFRIKTLEELKGHVNEIKNYFGESLSLRNSVFLGSASALMIPQEKLLPMLDHIVKEIWELTRGYYNYGLNSFLEVRSALKKSVEDYREIEKRRVRTIYLGIESGSNKVLGELNKPHTKEEAIEAVNRIKAAGLFVGLIFLVGLDGNHLEETKDLLDKVKIEYPDHVFLSKLVPNDGTTGIEVDEEFTEKQMFEFYKFLKQKQERTKPREFYVREYEIENFFYW